MPTSKETSKETSKDGQQLSELLEALVKIREGRPGERITGQIHDALIVMGWMEQTGHDGDLRTYQITSEGYVALEAAEREEKRDV